MCTKTSSHTLPVSHSKWWYSFSLLFTKVIFLSQLSIIRKTEYSKGNNQSHNNTYSCSSTLRGQKVYPGLCREMPWQLLFFPPKIKLFQKNTQRVNYLKKAQRNPFSLATCDSTDRRTVQSIQYGNTGSPERKYVTDGGYPSPRTHQLLQMDSSTFLIRNRNYQIPPPPRAIKQFPLQTSTVYIWRGRTRSIMMNK